MRGLEGMKKKSQPLGDRVVIALRICKKWNSPTQVRRIMGNIEKVLSKMDQSDTGSWEPMVVIMADITVDRQKYTPYKSHRKSGRQIVYQVNHPQQQKSNLFQWHSFMDIYLLQVLCAWSGCMRFFPGYRLHSYDFTLKNFPVLLRLIDIPENKGYETWVNNFY